MMPNSPTILVCMLVLDLLCNNKDVILFCDHDNSTSAKENTPYTVFIDYTNNDNKTKFEFKDTNNSERNFFAYLANSSLTLVTFL